MVSGFKKQRLKAFLVGRLVVVKIQDDAFVDSKIPMVVVCNKLGV